MLDSPQNCAYSDADMNGKAELTRCDVCPACVAIAKAHHKACNHEYDMSEIPTLSFGPRAEELESETGIPATVVVRSIQGGVTETLRELRKHDQLEIARLAGLLQELIKERPPVDVAGLKKKVSIFDDDYGRDKAWNACVDHINTKYNLTLKEKN